MGAGLQAKLYLHALRPKCLNVPLGASVQQPFAAVPGGVLCRDAESGAVIGAIGVSGASADEDEHMAIVGAQACGFKTEPATSALN